MNCRDLALQPHLAVPHLLLTVEMKRIYSTHSPAVTLLVPQTSYIQLLAATRAIYSTRYLHGISLALQVDHCQLLAVAMIMIFSISYLVEIPQHHQEDLHPPHLAGISSMSFLDATHHLHPGDHRHPLGVMTSIFIPAYLEVTHPRLLVLLPLRLERASADAILGLQMRQIY